MAEKKEVVETVEVVETPAEEKQEVAVEEKTAVAEVKQETSTAVGNPFSDTKDFNNVMIMAKRLASTDLVPQAYKGKPENCLIAIDYANRLGVSPFALMKVLTIVKGNAVINGTGSSMLVKASRRYSKDKLIWIGEEGKDTWGAYVTAYDNENEEWVKGAKVTMAMAKSEGWINNPKWKSMPELMISYRAYAFFCRVHLANEMNGFNVEGEMEDIEYNRNSRRTVDNPF